MTVPVLVCVFHANSMAKERVMYTSNHANARVLSLSLPSDIVKGSYSSRHTFMGNVVTIIWRSCYAYSTTTAKIPAKRPNKSARTLELPPVDGTTVADGVGVAMVVLPAEGIQPALACGCPSLYWQIGVAVDVGASGCPSDSFVNVRRCNTVGSNRFRAYLRNWGGGGDSRGCLDLSKLLEIVLSNVLVKDLPVRLMSLELARQS